MRKELIKTEAGISFYSFVYYNTFDQKRIRLSRDYIRARFGKDISDPDEADKILEILSKELNTLSNEKDKRLTLTTEEYNFSNLLGMYEESQRKIAPNSYKNSVHYLKYYVLHFFLRVKKCSELTSWHFFYEDFKDWLENAAYLLRRPDQLISFASKNHAIKALNTFMRCMHKKRYLLTLYLCSSFNAHLLKEKSLDEVVSFKEMEKVYSKFLEKGEHNLGLFYRLLFFTGLRFNEARGISIENIFPGSIEDAGFNKRLKENKISYHGYLVINSQPLSKTRLRSEDGHVRRKPLKSRKKIDEKSSRVIPITDKIVWEGLAGLYNQLLVEYKKNIFGGAMGNYLLFESANGTAYTKLKKMYDLANVPFRNWHALRHTRATYLIGETGDFLLTRLWLGHKNQAVLEKYVHVYQAIVRNAKKTDKDKKELKPILLAG